MFYEPTHTPYDLNWRMLGTDVRVNPWFWMISALMGWGLVERGFGYLIAWIICVFVSILVHEFGHIFMGRLFGSHGHIVLYSFGGLAVGSKNLTRRWQRVLVSFAGPLAGFVLAGLVFAVYRFTDAEKLPERAHLTLGFLLAINIYWGIMNLLPVWPLDGGQISREFFDWLMPQRGLRVAYSLSMIVAGLLALNSLAAQYGRAPLPYLPRGGLYFALLFGMLALGSWQMLQSVSQRKPWDQDDDQSDER